MGPTEVDVASADRGHSHLVVGAGKEARKRIQKRNFASGRESHPGADEILFRDISLIEVVGIRVLKDLRER
jgi:hypothetical protein